MDEALRAAWLDTGYRVRLPRGGWAAIRVGEAPPPALRGILGDRPWGYLTAWNPQAQPRPRALNRRDQRRLLAALKALPGVAVHAGIGVGRSGWREPSLLAVGLETKALDELAARYRQLAYVHGCGHGAARLRILGRGPY
jgi:hypothetical protein